VPTVESGCVPGLAAGAICVPFVVELCFALAGALAAGVGVGAGAVCPGACAAAATVTPHGAHKASAISSRAFILITSLEVEGFRATALQVVSLHQRSRHVGMREEEKVSGK
jgi:hypothetical protein